MPLKKLSFLLFLFLLCFFNSLVQVLAQKRPVFRASGTHFSDEVKAFFSTSLTQIAAYNDSTSRGIIDVPVKVHLVAQSDGQGALSLNEVREAFAKLNAAFIPAHIRFVVLDDFGRILNDKLYKMQREHEQELVKTYDQKGVINVYVVHTIESEEGGCCGYTYPPMTKEGKDRLFITQRCFKGEAAFIRQMGHYFGLYPTHGPDADKRSGELADGRNCETEGDQICDTPADPQLNNQNVNERCLYTGSLLDAQGKYYRPLTNNYMSDNARAGCVNAFTRQQYRRLAWTAENLRTYLSFPKTGYSSKELRSLQTRNGMASNLEFKVNSLAPNLHLNTNLYQVHSKVFTGDLWKISMDNPNKIHIYVFEGDSSRQIQLLYPKPQDPKFNQAFTLPLEGEGWTFEQAGKRQLCVLFSRQALNAQSILKKLNEPELKKLSLQERVYRLYDHDILPSRDVSYDKAKLAFSSVALGDAYIVPVLLEVEVLER